MNTEALLSGDARALRPYPQLDDVAVTVDGIAYLVTASVALPGRGHVWFQAWERSTITGPHSTISAGRGSVYGAVRTHLPTNEALPLAEYPYGSKARIDAVDAHVRAQQARAVAVVYAAHPWLAAVGTELAGEVMAATRDIPANGEVPLD